MAIPHSIELTRAALITDSAIDRFYHDDFIDLMDEGLAPEMRRPKHLAGA